MHRNKATMEPSALLMEPLMVFFSRHLMHKLYKVAFRLPSTSDAKDVRIIFCFLVINR